MKGILAELLPEGPVPESGLERVEAVEAFDAARPVRWAEDSDRVAGFVLEIDGTFYVLHCAEDWREADGSGWNVVARRESVDAATQWFRERE